MIDERFIPTLKRTYRPRLTKDQVTEIKKLLDAGVMNKVIAIDFNVSDKTVSAIRKGLYHKGA